MQALSILGFLLSFARFPGIAITLDADPHSIYCVCRIVLIV
jgi:hypothetical protein